jgi:GNAT superfamily N-acetyltransferase
MTYAGEKPSAAPNLQEAARERGWPDGLLERALELRVPLRTVEGWLRGPWSDVEYVRRRLEWHERLTFGTLRGREATPSDNDAFSELFANAPEEVGEWEIYTERSPNAFAQFRLQERVTVLVLEEGGRLIATCAFAPHKVLVAGKRLSVHYGQALRVHKDFRRQGYGDQVRSLSWAIDVARPTHAQYDYTRSQNFAVVNWWKKYVPTFFDDVPQREGAVPGIPVTVMQYPARPFDGDARGIRRVRPADIARCVGLINATHRGLDLFRPYSTAFLSDRLDDGYWGEPPPGGWFHGWPHVYGWEDYCVLEEDGRVVACAGLWDKGRDMRDRWRHKETSEEKTVSTAAVLDFGFAPGREDAMERLLRYLMGETARLGRDYLAIPLDWLPALAERLEPCEPVAETRSLRWGLREPEITRPYTDLSYF